MIENFLGNLPYGINLVDILVFIILILIITTITGSFNRRKLNKKINDIPGYDINTKLISDVANINKKLDEFSIIHQELRLKISELQNRDRDIIKIKTVKYNPYKDMGVGGNQSFSTAFIDQNGNGIILTNLYSRERTRVMLKEINNFNSEKELTPEEKQVLDLTKI